MSAVEDTLEKTRDAYPADLARFVRERWDEERAGALPDQGTLETLISACYQAGLLREEERAVTFRVILCDPDRLPPREGPPDGMHRLEFPEAQTVRRPGDKAALTRRRLLPLAHRGLFGRGRGLRDLGSRPLGTEVVEGRTRAGGIPRRLCRVLWSSACTVPGRIAVDVGLETLCKLDEGRTLGRLDGRIQSRAGSPPRSRR